MSVHAYSLKFTQLSLYTPKFVADMSIHMIQFVDGLSYLSSKEGKTPMLIEEMNIMRLMVYVHQVAKEKLRDKKEFKTIKLRQEYVP